MSSSQATSSKQASECKEICTVDDFIKNGFKALIEATKCANDLPKGDDFTYYETTDSFTQDLNAQSNRLLNLINDIFVGNEVDANIRSQLQSKDEAIGDANDIILDRAVAGIDDIKGLKNSPAEPELQLVSAELRVNGSWNRVQRPCVEGLDNTSTNSTTNNSVRLLTAKNIVRPQSYFKDKIDNSNAKPWMPRISEKPNSLKPLALYVEPVDEDDENAFEEYSHPYEFELEHFIPSEEFLRNVEDVKEARPLVDTELCEIQDEDQLDALVDALRKEKQIAVDLEHHSYRSFQGITCLLQISTKSADYLVDTLSLRHKLFVLNEIFTKPSIVKIFHGASCDIQWLQRDLSLYVVNMFDTHQAAKLLGYSGLSLSYLLNRFCSFVPNKKFQLADWRIRPLPQELKDYAREDTHYLIYIYEMLKKELYAKSNGCDNLVKAVFEESKQICKIKYIKPRWTPSSHLHLHQRRKKLFDNRQMYALKELYKWRDNRAREDDESVGYVLPNHMLLQIAEMLPREVQGIFACCNLIPPLVRAYSLELHHIILKAREQPLQKVIMPVTNRRIISKESVRLNIDNPLHCPHDMSKQAMHDNFETLLNIPQHSFNDSKIAVRLEKQTPLLHIFKTQLKAAKSIGPMESLTFLGPYERYKLMKPFLEAKAAKEAQEIAEKETNDSGKSIEERDRFAFPNEDVINVAGNSINEQTKKSNHILTSDRPLIQMSGAKKRKRELSDDRESHTQPQKNYQQMKKHKVRTEPEISDQANQNQHWQSNRGRNFAKRKANRFDYEQQPHSSFDYSSVDFNQFSGGGRAVQQTHVKTKHRGKGNYHHRGYAYNQGKSMTFHHNSRGRGRGRGGNSYY